MAQVNTRYHTHVSDDEALRVWDIRSGDLLRSFPVGGISGLRIGEWPKCVTLNISIFFKNKI